MSLTPYFLLFDFQRRSASLSVYPPLVVELIASPAEAPVTLTVYATGGNPSDVVADEYEWQYALPDMPNVWQVLVDEGLRRGQALEPPQAWINAGWLLRCCVVRGAQAAYSPVEDLSKW